MHDAIRDVAGEDNGDRTHRKLNPLAAFVQERTVYLAGPIALLLLIIRLLLPPAVFSHNPSWGELDKIGTETEWAVFLGAVLFVRIWLWTSKTLSHRAAGFVLAAAVWTGLTFLFFLSNRPGSFWLFGVAFAVGNIAAALDPRSWR